MTKPFIKSTIAFAVFTAMTGNTFAVEEQLFRKLKQQNCKRLW
jgi:hypothetical protein